MSKRRSLCACILLCCCLLVQPAHAQLTTKQNEAAAFIKENDWDEIIRWVSLMDSNRYEPSDIPNIYKSLLATTELFRDYISTRLILHSGKEREENVAMISEVLQNVQRFAVLEAENYPPLGEIAFDCALMNKGFQLAMLSHTESLRRRLITPELKKLWESINHLKRLKVEMYDMMNNPATDEAYRNMKKKAISEGDSAAALIVKEFDETRERLSELDEIIEKKEKELNHALRTHLLTLQDFYVDWKAIRKWLKEDEVVVEFLSSPKIPYKTNSGFFYHALILKHNDVYPQVVRLKLEDDPCETTETTGRQHTANQAATHMYDLVWKQIEEHLEGINEVYVVPTGSLNTVSFARVRNDRGAYITDLHTIHHVITSRDLLRLRIPKKIIRSKNVFLFGGADYGLPNKHAVDRGQGVSYLPESKNEVIEIHRIIDSWSEATCFTGEEASKTNFISITGYLQAPYIIHLSTHGFFFQKRMGREYDESMVLDSYFLRESNNPLKRCGLLFSGANHLWEGNEVSNDTDNGILTADEISKLDLSTTRLVVLSACDTGRGDVDYNEGIYGLQRAFRLAGVESMIVSLRKVPDKETKELMVGFYKYLVTGIGLKKSFDSAQKEMRNKYPDNPEKWAEFVLIE